MRVKVKGIAILILGLLLFTSCAKSEKEFQIKELNYPDYLKIVKRADWGWLPLEKEKELKEAPINVITIHHSGVEFTENHDPITATKNLQKWSRAEKGWIDIPYHFRIDLQGNIYEARPINIPGDTNTEYDPTGHALVEVMGNFEVQELTETQRQSLIEIIAFLSKEFNVPLTKVKTHKDYSETTLCPGENIYKYFQDGTIIKSVELKLNPAERNKS